MGIPARRLSILILSACLSFVAMGCGGTDEAQTTGQANGADPAATSTIQTQTAAQNTTGTQNGVWRHFGDEKGATPARAPATGVWHHFGPSESARSKATPAPVRTSASNGEAAPVRAAPAKTVPRPSAAGRQYSGMDTREMERQMFELINRDRANSGGGRLRPLRWNETLATVAREHSLDMIRRGYFGHVAPDGKSVLDRLSAAGIAWKAEGENIAIDDGVVQAESAFMNEPRFEKNHRWNILNPDYTDVGVGVVEGPGGEYYITQDFIETESGR